MRFADGHTLRAVGGKLLQAGSLATDEFDLAGCPRPLTKWLTNQVNTGGSIEVSSARIDGRPVYAVSFPTAKPRLSLFITRPGGLPTMLTISGRDLRGTTRLTYGTRP